MSVVGSCELHRKFSQPIKCRGFGHGNLRSFQAAQFVGSAVPDVCGKTQGATENYLL